MEGERMIQQRRSSKKHGAEEVDPERERGQAKNRAKRRDWDTQENVKVSDDGRYR